ncbi:hypothetical protein GCM10027059_26640 [Myceligenerans halotolerans]
MPLPTTDLIWPPEQLKNITPRLHEWDAWYVGTPERLEKVYGRSITGPRAVQRPNGPIGRIYTRLWWGRQTSQESQRGDHMHIPIAADLARTSANLLYSEPPSLFATTSSTQTQDRLDEYAEGGLHDLLATGAEVGAALGGRYHRVTWDPSADMPFLSTVDADAAWPEFVWGNLVAVTFWTVVARNGNVVRRHLERHELDSAGMGTVSHGLYEGSENQLGRPIPLTEQPETAPYATRVGMDGALVDLRTPGLCVAYIPNATPAKEWRTDPVGRDLGESDWAGPIMGLMDAVDEEYSSLLRDIRLAKARIIVPSSMLDSNGPGKGANFDLDREVYEGVNAPPTEDGKQEITPQQFDIRVEEHLAAVADGVKRVISAAGYASATFEDGTDGIMTATEVHSRERKSYQTRGRKIRQEQPAVAYLSRKMMSIDAAIFRTPGLDWLDPVNVEFSDTVQDSALSMAQTVQSLQIAQAASVETRVQMVHSDWDDEQIKEEAAKIMAETGTPLPDPFQIQA